MVSTQGVKELNEYAPNPGFSGGANKNPFARWEIEDNLGHIDKSTTRVPLSKVDNNKKRKHSSTESIVEKIMVEPDIQGH